MTVATNMAGRGVDIILGGNAEGMAQQRDDRRAAGTTTRTCSTSTRRRGTAEYEAEFKPLLREVQEADRTPSSEEVVEAGGLYVLGTERHESRRIDNQLRGRSGRQGDPGESRFYLSLEDDLMRLFASDRIAGDDGAAQDPRRRSHRSQDGVARRSSARRPRSSRMNFEIRKNVLKYDEVMDKQRQVIYGERRRILEGEDFHDEALELVTDVVEATVDEHANPDLHPEEWDWEQLFTSRARDLPDEPEAGRFRSRDGDHDEVVERFLKDGARGLRQARGGASVPSRCARSSGSCS